MEKALVWNKLFAFLFPATLFSAVGVLSFSVSFHIEKVLFCLMLVSFLAVLIPALRNNRPGIRERVRYSYRSSRFLWCSLGLYLLWDLTTMFYSPDIGLVLGMLPQYPAYLLLIPIGLFYCTDKGRIRILWLTMAGVGSAVSAGALILYFFTRRPVYFQRLSTAPDYNVFSTLILVSLLFVLGILSHSDRLSRGKRFLWLVVLLSLNMPVLYLAGSRRMMIMLPYFFTFVVIFEGISLCRTKPAARLRCGERFAMVFLCAAFYLASSGLAGPFADYGAQKEFSWEKYKAEQEQLSPPETPDGKPPAPGEATISNVIESIESGAMTGKRRLIYSVALQDLSSFSAVELLFGRGASYDMYLFDHTKDAKLLSAYGYDAGNPPYRGWMSAHNFVIADLLNGGIIKLSLTLFLIGSVCAALIGATRRDDRIGIPFILLLALVVANNFISGAYGFLNDVFFILLLLFIFAVRERLYHPKGEISFANAANLYSDERSPA